MQEAEATVDCLSSTDIDSMIRRPLPILFFVHLSIILRPFFSQILYNVILNLC